MALQAQYRVKAIIGVPLKAADIASGVSEAKELTKNVFSMQIKGFEVIDGHEELIGVTGDWDIA